MTDFVEPITVKVFQPGKRLRTGIVSKLKTSQRQKP